MRFLRALLVSVVLVVTGAGPVSANGQSNRSLEAAVTKFVLLEYEHGVPYEEAHDFGPQALPTLIDLLGNEGFKHHWENIIQVICYIGSPAGFEPLRSFIQDRFHGEVDEETFGALSVAQNSLGPIAASSPEALEYLVKGTDPAYWASLPWTPGGRGGAKPRILWSKLTINALSMTGSARAGRVLERLEQHPYSEKQRANITEGLRRHKTVVSIGLDTYLRKSHAGEIKY